MKRSRKYFGETLHSIKALKSRHQYLEKELVRLSGQQSYSEIQNHYDSMIDKLNSEMDALPIGHRYTGTFYVKIPYTVPTEFEKINGSVFMREDLVSWMIDGADPVHNQNYFRTIFKEPNFNREIKREEADLVYADTK